MSQTWLPSCAAIEGRIGARLARCLGGALLSLALPSLAQAVPYVKSVEYVEIALGNAATTASATLTKGQVVTSCVPFASMMVAGADNAFDQVFVDIFFQTGPARVTAQRTAAGGSLSVGVFVVEFDPAYVNVQQGTFTLTGAATQTAAITAVTLTKAALVSYYRGSATTDAWEDFALAGWFSAANQLSWQRNNNTGNINGHYYVFEARNSEFAVQAVSFAVGNNQPSATAAITAVDMDKTMVVASYRTSYAADDNEDGQIAVFLANPTTVQAQRTFQNSGPNQIQDVRAFVVQLGGNVRVQRGTLAYADTATQQTAAVRQVDLASTMVWNGTSIGPGTMESEATSSVDGDTGFERLKLANATTVQGDRDGTCSGADCQGIGHFEVVEFNPSGQMLVKSGAYTGNATDNRPIFVGFPPDLVVLKRDAATFAVMRSSTMAGDVTKSLDLAGAAVFADGIQSLDAQGFTVGTNVQVNGAGDTYHWVAFKAAPGEMKVGTYTGNNTDNRSITGVGFQPEYVITLPVVGGGAGIPLHRSSSMTGDTSYDFDAVEVGPPANAIQALEADGFQIGTHASVNTNLATYHYIAWNAVPGRMAVGTYTGTGVDSTNFDIVGFFPEWVLVKRTGDQRPWNHKPAATGVNTNYSLTTSNFVGQPDDLQQLRPLGFQVGFGPEGFPDRTNDSGITYHWVAFGPHQAPVNYRSIGTAPAYGTGSITVNPGSADVTGAGTAWLTNNRGRGDVLTVPCPDPPTCTGGVNYPIFQVASNTTLRLATEYTGTGGSGLTYLVRRQFTTLQGWEDCIDGQGATPPPAGPCFYFPAPTSSLVNDDRSEVGIAYKESAFLYPGAAPIVQFNGSATDATHTITLTADPGNRHLGIRGNGVVLDMNGATSDEAVDVRDEFVTVEWLEIRNAGSGGDGIEVSGITPGNQVVIRNNLIHNVTVGVQIQDNDVNIDVYNNIVHDNGRNIRLDQAVLGSVGIRIFNNTVFRGTSGSVPSGISALAPGPYPTVTVRNNIAHSNSLGDYDVAGLNTASSHNISGDATGTTHSPAGGGIDSVALAALSFVSTTSGSENLHIQAGSAAQNVGTDLSAYLNVDIDGAGRLAPWEIGADDISGTTAVDLASFTARGVLDPTGASGVDLLWATASELDNLGFHLYRSLSAQGPWERITSSLIPGLGSSPTGTSYSYRDGGLQNGTTYYYLLEDVETTGRTERHGPIWADAGAGGGDGSGGGGGEPGGGDDEAGESSSMRYGDAGEPSLRVVERGPSHVLLELTTPGFEAVKQADGTVRLSVAGFEASEVVGAPEVPLKSVVVDAVAGRRVQVATVMTEDLLRFEGLPLAAAGARTVVVSASGTVRPGLSPRHLDPATRRGGYYPRLWARLSGTAFQGETKKALLELAPLRYDAARETILLARRLLVRVDFTGKETAERGFGGARGRRPPPASLRSRGVLAQLVTKEAGLYRVGFEEVFGSSRRGVPLSSLRLSRRGEAVAYHVEPERALFGPGSSLYFLGGGNLNPNGDAVYELSLVAGGLVMPVVSGTPTGPPATEYVATRVFEENRFYQAGLLEAKELWQWDLLVSPVSKSYPFTISAPAPSTRLARVRAWLQGASDFEADPDHHLRLLVNGNVVGEAFWDGKTERLIEGEVLPGVLVEGTNTLSLENVGDTGAAYSMVFLNRYEVSYPRQLLAEAGKLEGAFPDSGAVEVVGLTETGFVVETGSPAVWLKGVEAGGGGLRFRSESGKSYLAVAASSLLRPQLRRSVSSGLKAGTQVDWLLVAPREFLPAALPLLELRRRQGLKTRAVAIEDVYEEFGYGEAGPHALKAFLEHAYHRWPRPSLRYLLLLGDSTYDPKDYLRTKVADRVPFHPVKTSYLWTASDPAFGAVNGEDLLPDLAVGRLPASSLAEAQALIAKLLAFETAGRSFAGRAVLVADNADLGGAFETDADEIASTVLAHREVRKLYLRDLGAGTRAEIVGAFDAGPGLLSYVGHGATAVWASENVFNNSDVASLSAQSQQPLLLTLNCLNGFFHFPPLNSLAEALLKAEGKGAIAAFSPSGLSLNGPAHLYHKALLAEIESGRHDRLGDALLAAQAAYANSGTFPELLAIYHLFADPAQMIR